MKDIDRLELQLRDVNNFLEEMRTRRPLDGPYFEEVAAEFKDCEDMIFEYKDTYSCFKKYKLESDFLKLHEFFFIMKEIMGLSNLALKSIHVRIGTLKTYCAAAASALEYVSNANRTVQILDWIKS